MARACAYFLSFCCLMLHFGAPLPSASAQSTPKAVKSERLPEGLLRGQSKVDANAGTVSIVTIRTLDSPLMRAALDLSVLLDEGERFEKMRVLPIVSRGKMQNLWDILYLNGVDMGFLASDTLEVLSDDPQIDYIKDRIRYIAVMFPEEVTIVARSEIASLKDLEGKKVSINAKGTSTNVTAPLIFRRLGIKAEMESVEHNVALERMRTGDLAAHVMVQGKPARPVQALKGEGLHILPVPYTEALLDLYLPSRFTSEDYPNLIPAGKHVDTIAVSQVLAAINVAESTDRYRKLARFVDSFFSRIDELRKPGFLPLWKDVNIGAQVKGWTRFKGAQDWLDRRAKQEVVVKTDLRDTFNSYLKQSGPNTSGDKEKLFEEFLKWQRDGKR